MLARAAAVRRILLALTIVVLGVAIPARARIAFDAAASGSTSGSSTLSWSHTIGSGNDRILVVGLSISIASPYPTASSKE